MLAITFTAVLALYLLGPDQFSRLILGFTIPRRNVTLTRGEEICRALVWATASAVPAYLWLIHSNCYSSLWHSEQAKVFFAGLYSETAFNATKAKWFESLVPVMWLNWAFLWRVYAITGLLSLILSALTVNYGRIRKHLKRQWMRTVFASIILPRVALWHLLLSDVLLESTDTRINLDVLTKSDTLYQGRLADKALASDGSLASITLADPRRFRRKEYMIAKEAGQKPNAADFWQAIPTNMFVVIGSELQTLNLRYAPDLVIHKDRSDELDKQLKALVDAVRLSRQAAVDASIIRKVP
jgi:hypothetical protein